LPILSNLKLGYQAFYLVTDVNYVQSDLGFDDAFNTASRR
jgi:hypothetical protein